MITIEFNDGGISEALDHAAAELGDMSPLMNQIAALMIEQTHRRFVDQKAPDGTAWAPRSPATLAIYERRSKKPEGQRRWGGVLRYTGQLNDNIFPSYGPDFARVSSPEPYAAAMQFGARKGSLGAYWFTTAKGNVVEGSSPWGDIPARPFFGVSEEDRSDILDLVEDYVAAALGT